jgi:hypothetical protein
MSALGEPGARSHDPFYANLAARSSQLKRRTHHVVDGGGFGCRIEAGQVLRIRLLESPQIVDLCLANADDPTEHYASGTQVALEGLNITRLSPIWGTPPKSRRLATCIADTVIHRDNPGHTRDHGSHGAHCNPHHWMLYAGRHPDTCYDNLRAGMAMVGLSQHAIHDNINLFENCVLDPYTGHYFLQESDAERDDYLDFYAEVSLLAVLSLCPYGSGGAMEDDWHVTDIPVYPVSIEVFDSGVERPRPRTESEATSLARPTAES